MSGVLAPRRPSPLQRLGQARLWGMRPLSWAVLTCLCTFIVLSALSGLVAYQHVGSLYTSDTQLASQGVQHLRSAERLIGGLTRNPFDAQATATATQEFRAALHDFAHLDRDLHQIPSAARSIPHYGSYIRAADDVLPLAAELSQAGILGCTALNLINMRLGNPLDTRTTGLSSSDFSVIQQDFDQVMALLNTAADQVRHLRPEDLQVDPRIAQAVAKVRAVLPTLQDEVPTIESLLGVVPVVLGIGTPTSYLIEQLDSTELRPGGGFIGTYGIATLSGGRLSAIEMTDVDLLDRPFEFAGHTIPYPPAYAWFSHLSPGSWSLRDSNLDADFPTAARYAEQIYHAEGGTAQLQGVIAVTPQFIENALEITGPIYVSEYNETITAQNLIDRIHYHQLRAQEGADYIPDPTGHSSLRKRFTSYLFDHFLARVRQILPTTMPKFVTVLTDSLRSKDVQVYVNSSAGESLLQHFHLASTIDAPAGDSLFVVDANQVANKANDFMTYALNDKVAVDASGTAVHQTTLNYTWPISDEATQNNYGSKTYYLDYLRIYLPPGSSLKAVNGWQPQGPSQAFGRQVWGGPFSFFYGQRLTITLTWVVPRAATSDGADWHYHYLIQRQSGVSWNVALQIALPPCAVITGKPLTLSATSNQHAELSQPLTADLDLGVDYACTG